MSEPDFISQTSEPMTKEERWAWWCTRADEAKAQGATHARASWHETIPNLILFEGWKVRPEDDGEPRWQLAASKSGLQ